MGVKEAIASVVVRAAACLLPPEQSDWAYAMRAEYGEALDGSRPMSFALGCFIAALKVQFDVPAARFAILRSGMVLATLVPLATFHLGCAYGALRFASGGPDHFHATLRAGTEAQRHIAAAYAASAPLIAALLFVLGGAHLAAAWHLMSWRLRPALAAGGAGLLAATGLTIMIVSVMANWHGVAVQFAGAGVEVVLLLLFALWAKRLNPGDYNAVGEEVRT